MTFATPDALQKLLAVQEKDNEVLALQHQIKQLPERKEIENADDEQKELLQRIKATQSELHDNERNQKRLEDEVSILEDRATRQQEKLYSGEVKAIKELQALEADIEGLKQRQRLVEDQIIEVMELNEPIIAKVQTLQDSSAEIETKISALQKSLQASEEGLEEAIKQTKLQRDEIKQDLPTELTEIYENLQNRPGSVGVALLVGFTCRGCHLDLPAVEVDRIKKLPNDTLVNCEECGCILVR
tara:strand:- start:302 stop:1030 length:729 start_codon:yes stop_codon:yes gene_type:complete